MSIQKAIEQFLEKKEFVRFDTFFTGFLLGSHKESYTENERGQAFAIFYEKTAKRKIASYPTMRKWFGLGGVAKPKRMQIFEIAFAMEYSVDDVNILLMKGLFEPGIRINDYRETIFLFGIVNHLSFEECCFMIENFECQLHSDLVVVQATNTAELWNALEHNMQLSKDEFMDWMCHNAGGFKGYSKTSLNYMLKLKKVVIAYMRKDWKVILEKDLESTGYEKWKHKRGKHRKQSEGERIRKYVYQDKTLTMKTRKDILDMVSFVYFEEENNVRLLSEIFSNRCIASLPNTCLRGMTKKHLSDLLNIARQKERDIRLTAIRCELLQLQEKGEKRCPEAIHKQIGTCIEKNSLSGEEMVSELLAYISQYMYEQKRRLVQIERADILPLIQYVAWYRYEESMNESGRKYVAKEARQQFVQLADQILAACNMAPISEKYELDSLLLLGFQKEDCYLYSEMAEQLMVERSNR